MSAVRRGKGPRGREAALPGPGRAAPARCGVTRSGQGTAPGGDRPVGCGASTPPAPPPRSPHLLLYAAGERPARVGRLLFLFRSRGFQTLVQSHAEAPLAQLSVTPITPAPHPPYTPRADAQTTAWAVGDAYVFIMTFWTQTRPRRPGASSQPGAESVRPGQGDVRPPGSEAWWPLRLSEDCDKGQGIPQRLVL